jgi:Holliday junction resolvasome RuvABC ATP-dependent DNA helicase subunit
LKISISESFVLYLDDFAGQDQVLENLKVFVQAANQRNEALDHTLFHGPPGLGKTTLANILANELQVGIKKFWTCTRLSRVTCGFAYKS